ncbi:hypothetical protein CLAFUW4_04632 [Fulvia fulva]|uniref:Uncharacterized protein n=1 Tax=Passalora fulva TaxID=5499 RepID=A0A9Q8LGJ0_PASFU|nr:uncharacterized protein CLAFUR5_04593 [Fulvia fulva]KAK4626100.1 hypothetical protein CLAFUR4_04618 [Fulvia fulva]KAK4628521.1 hypothetical protein CLAFUR0_04621 [Fulvia fulva]UJO16992.1 hypothetical protein CLAFUR5_04593 [Fulvia fulva]WPV13706.1 hypothetical protein CLAFUW4_04632 [Fulvia fulva]WPV28566.1 hypothetical protein CLAFUW7_04625 [Fulvia fulva]
MADSGSSSTGRRTVTKSQFFAQLSLDEESDEHRRIFVYMQQEASAGCRRLLAPGRHDSADHVDEIGFRQEVLQIYQAARPETRRLYDLGVVTGPDGIANDNWVVRWILWQTMHQPNGY